MEQTIPYITAFLMAICGLVLIVKMNKHPTDGILVVWLLLLSSVYSLQNYEWELCLTFTHCVFIYLYIKCSITDNKFRLKYLTHFIPAIISLIIVFFFPNNILYKDLIIRYVVVISYITIYFTVAIKMLIDYKKEGEAPSDYTPNFVWMCMVVGITILGHVVKIFPAVFFFSGTYGVNMIFIYAIILFLMVIVVLKAVRLEASFFTKTPKDTASTYHFEDSVIAELTQKLTELMTVQKLFLNPELNLYELANKMDISQHHLSFLLNTKLDQTFYDFINSFRLEEVKNELINVKNKHLSIYAISKDCGFNSQSTFNRVFKQKVGMSPSQYREMHS